MNVQETYSEALARARRARRTKALKLQEAGLKLTEIADVMGLKSKQHAHALVKQARAEREQAAAS